MDQFVYPPYVHLENIIQWSGTFPSVNDSQENGVMRKPQDSYLLPFSGYPNREETK